MIKLLIYGAAIYFVANKMGYKVVKTSPVQGLGYCHPMAPLVK